MQDIKDLADNGIHYRPQLVPDFFQQHLPSKRLETTRPSTKFVHVFSKWPFYPLKQGTFEDDVPFPRVGSWRVHLGRLTWNLQITRLERKKIFQTSMIMVHVNFPGCITHDHPKKVTLCHIFFPEKTHRFGVQACQNFGQESRSVQEIGSDLVHIGWALGWLMR